MRKVLNNKVLLIIVAVLLLANIGMVLYFLAMRDPMRRNNPRGDHQRSPITEFLQSQVGFNQQQMVELEKVRQKHRQILKPLFEDIRAAKVQFYGMLKNPVVNDSLLNLASSAIGEKQRVLDMQTFKNFLELRSLCTPQQQPMYDSLIVNEISKMWFPTWKGNGRQEKDSTKSNH